MLRVTLHGGKPVCTLTMTLAVVVAAGATEEVERAMVVAAADMVAVANKTREAETVILGTASFLGFHQTRRPRSEWRLEERREYGL